MFPVRRVGVGSARPRWCVAVRLYVVERRIVRSRRPAHPAITSVEDFTRVQLLRRSKRAAGLPSARKTERSGRPVTKLYLFRGRIRCDVCKRKTEGSPRKRAICAASVVR